MGDADKNEDPKSLYTFVHHLTPQGLEQQLLSTQVCHSLFASSLHAIIRHKV